MTIVSSQARAVPLNPPSSGNNWQQILKEAVRDPAELCDLLNLPQHADSARRAAEKFPVFVPRGFLKKIQPGDSQDPLLRQVLPLEAELQSPPGFSADPVGDQPSALLPGLLQKYGGRVLMVTTGACAVHCRYCFRRDYPYDDSPPAPAVWQRALDRIAEDTSIREVLLSGGDPLTVRDELLADLVKQLSRISHLRRLRIHSRLPIVIPERVTDSLLDWLCSSRLTPIFVVHANHPRELDAEVLVALEHLVKAGIPVLNQAVLLRGVNDRVSTLVDLCEKLIDARVFPYYLHQLDRVSGAAHFEVPVERGLELLGEIRKRLPGYAVPRYVQEKPGQLSKLPLG